MAGVSRGAGVGWMRRRGFGSGAIGGRRLYVGEVVAHGFSKIENSCIDGVLERARGRVSGLRVGRLWWVCHARGCVSASTPGRPWYTYVHVDIQRYHTEHTSTRN